MQLTVSWTRRWALQQCDLLDSLASCTTEVRERSSICGCLSSCFHCLSLCFHCLSLCFHCLKRDRSQQGEQLIELVAENCTILMLNCTPTRADELLHTLERDCLEGSESHRTSWLGTTRGIVTLLDITIAKPTPVPITLPRAQQHNRSCIERMLLDDAPPARLP